MKNGCLCVFQSFRDDAVSSHRKPLDRDAVGFIDFRYLFIGRILDGIDPVSSKQLNDQRIKILGTRADHNLIHRHMHAAAAGKIAHQLLAQLNETLSLRLAKKKAGIICQYPPQRLIVGGLRKHFLPEGNFMPAGQRFLILCTVEVIGTIDYEASAALPAFDIAFFLQNVKGMFDGDQGYAFLIAQHPFPRQTFPFFVYAGNDGLLQLAVHSEIRFFFFFLHLTLSFYCISDFSQDQICLKVKS